MNFLDNVFYLSYKLLSGSTKPFCSANPMLPWISKVLQEAMDHIFRQISKRCGLMKDSDVLFLIAFFLDFNSSLSILMLWHSNLPHMTVFLILGIRVGVNVDKTRSILVSRPFHKPVLSQLWKPVSRVVFRLHLSFLKFRACLNIVAGGPAVPALFITTACIRIHIRSLCLGGLVAVFVFVTFGQRLMTSGTKVWDGLDFVRYGRNIVQLSDDVGLILLNPLLPTVYFSKDGFNVL